MLTSARTTVMREIEVAGLILFWWSRIQDGMLYPRLLLEDLHITCRGLERLRGRQMRDMNLLICPGAKLMDADSELFSSLLPNVFASAKMELSISLAL
jgi:hypothetical protein